LYNANFYKPTTAIMKSLYGTGVALVTPFNENLQVDFKALEKLLIYTAQAQVDYWVVHGTTGETATTSTAEKKEILAFIKAHNPRRIPIVYGLGGPHTADVVSQLAQVDWQGIAAILSVSPYYNRPSQEGIFLHYQTLAAAAPVPIVLYNVPARTGMSIAPETVLRLSQVPNIGGIKEASGNLLAALEIASKKPPNFLLIAGDDALTIPLIALGAVGVIATLANVLPQPIVAMVQAALTNNYTKAREILYKIVPACNFIAQQGNPVGTKLLLAAQQCCQPHVRLPLASPGPTALQEAKACLQALNFEGIAPY
jgi:4-hydroxy-tetrahydrodipicolinate synthase